MALYFDISDWQVRKWESPPKGTRQQTILEHPSTGDIYYFKQSSPKYNSEFWSEVIVSEIGRLLKFDVLEYHIANLNGQLGCLSKNMIIDSSSMLYHGVDVLNDFIPEFKIIGKPLHTFQQIQHICSVSSGFQPFLKKFIEMIILDAIIGNTDRHTENWAFIISLNITLKEHKIKPEIDLWATIKHYFKNALKNLFLATPPQMKLTGKIEMETKMKYSFAPIYDSGSCLGREIDDDKIESFLKDKARIDVYLNKCKHEIRWNTEKLNCFELVRRIADVEADLVKDVCKRVYHLSNEQVLDKAIEEIDTHVNAEIVETYLTLQRKRLIKQLILCRIERLKKIIQID